MSDYYQQEVTKYMMRRAKKRAAAPLSPDAGAPVENTPRRGGWLARLGSLIPRRRRQSPVESTLQEKSPGPAR